MKYINNDGSLFSIRRAKKITEIYKQSAEIFRLN